MKFKVIVIGIIFLFVGSVNCTKLPVDWDTNIDPEVEKFIKKLDPAHPMRRPNYSCIPTFMRTPMYEDPGELDIALVGIPFDIGTTGRPGARLGPREIRNQSTVMIYQNHQSKIVPYNNCLIGDIGDVNLTFPQDIQTSMTEIEAFYRKLRMTNTIPITAGGDHSISYPILKGLAEEQPFALIHIDAHCDTIDITC
jgi:guanidinopropionase